MNDIHLTGSHANSILMSSIMNDLDSSFIQGLSKKSAVNCIAYMDDAIDLPFLQGLPEKPPKATKSQALALAQQLQLSLPLEVAVPSLELRRNSSKFKCRVHPKALPQTQYFEVAQGLLCASPALLLAQKCAGSSDIELIALMSLFMSVFAKDLETGNLVPRRKLVTPKEIESFAQRCKGERKLFESINRLDTLLPYAVQNTASPREIELGLMLLLPFEMGGCNLAGAEPNGKVKIPNSTRDRYCDLYWPEHAVGVDYDSDQEHTGIDALYSDSLHRNDLVAAGISLFTITNEQLSKLSLFNRTVTQICRALNAPIPPRSRLFHEKQLLLQAEIRGTFKECGF